MLKCRNIFFCAKNKKYAKLRKIKTISNRLRVTNQSSGSTHNVPSEQM